MHVVMNNWMIFLILWSSIRMYVCMHTLTSVLFPVLYLHVTLLLQTAQVEDNFKLAQESQYKGWFGVGTK